MSTENLIKNVTGEDDMNLLSSPQSDPDVGVGIIDKLSHNSINGCIADKSITEHNVLQEKRAIVLHLMETLRLKGGKGPKKESKEEPCLACDEAKAEKERKLSAAADEEEKLGISKKIKSKCDLHDDRVIESEEDDASKKGFLWWSQKEKEKSNATLVTDEDEELAIEETPEERKSKAKSSFKFGKIKKKVESTDVAGLPGPSSDHEGGEAKEEKRGKPFYTRIGIDASDVYKVTMFLIFYNVFAALK